MPALMRYEPPRAKRSRFVRGSDDELVSEQMRLFLAFQVAMQNLNALVENARPLDGGGHVVMLGPGGLAQLQAFIDDCATGREL
jgi:hypothetical protein